MPVMSGSLPNPLPSRQVPTPHNVNHTMSSTLSPVLRPASRRNGRQANRNALATPPKAVTQPSTRPHAIVLYWEDILMPVKWMRQHLALDQTPQSINIAAYAFQNSPQLRNMFESIENRVLELVQHAVTASKGMPVCILAESTTDYVERVTSVFFPRLTAALRAATTGIHVFGRPNTELNEYELLLWKKNMLHTICLEKLVPAAKSRDEAIWKLSKFGSGQVEMVALCATARDVNAVDCIREKAPYAVLKTARLGEQSGVGLEAFYHRLKALQEFIDQAVTRSSVVRVYV